MHDAPDEYGELDAVRIFEVLESHGVEYIVVGLGPHCSLLGHIGVERPAAIVEPIGRRRIVDRHLGPLG